MDREKGQLTQENGAEGNQEQLPRSDAQARLEGRGNYAKGKGERDHMYKSTQEWPNAASIGTILR